MQKGCVRAASKTSTSQEREEAQHAQQQQSQQQTTKHRPCVSVLYSMPCV
jgi:hypothetical protein